MSRIASEQDESSIKTESKNGKWMTDALYIRHGIDHERSFSVRYRQLKRIYTQTPCEYGKQGWHFGNASNTTKNREE